MKNQKRAKDTNLRAKNIVDLATGGIIEERTTKVKNPAAVELGRLGGLRGGKARATKLSAKRRKQIAQKAAKARWRNKD